MYPFSFSNLTQVATHGMKVLHKAFPAPYQGTLRGNANS